MEKGFSDIILPPTLFLPDMHRATQTYIHKHRHTFTILSNEHSLHTCYIPGILHLWTFIFNTIFTDRETSREVKEPLHSSPRKRCCRDLNPQSGFRVQAPNHDAPWQKIFESYTCQLFIKICLSPESSCSKSIYLLCLKLSKNSHIFKSVKWLRHTLKWLIKW